MNFKKTQYYKLTQFARYYISYAGWKFFALQILEIFNSTVSGIGILLILPLLNIAGYLDQSFSGASLNWIIQQIQNIGITINIYSILILYLTLNLFTAFSVYTQSVTELKLQQGFLQKIRSYMYASLLRTEWKHLVSQQQGNITFSTTTDIQQVNLAAHQFLRSLKSVLQLLVGIGLCAIISVKLTLLACITGSIYIIIQLFFLRKTLLNASLNRKVFQQLFSEVIESFSALKLIKSHAHEERHVDNFDKKTSNLSQQIIENQRLTHQQTLIQTIVITILITIYTLVSLKYMGVSGATLALFIIVISRITGAIRQGMNQFNLLLKALPSFIAFRKQLEALVPHKEYEKETDPKPLTCFSQIELKNISFEYSNSPEKRVLTNISLLLPANTTTAIIGPSGSGKTTLIDIITGLFEPSEGSLYVDDTLITGDNRRNWRRSLAYVSQDPFLNHDSIRNNLLEFAPEATEELMWKTLHIAQAEGFVKRLPNGLDSIVGDRGNNLSGGERQRIALARALMRQPQFLILDEATSNLDVETEKAIQKAIDELHGSITILVIAHRLSTIENADKTIVMKNGEIT